VSSPVLIEAALNGPTGRPAPWAADDAAQEGRRAVEAGAGLVHVHARTPDGAETSDPEWYRRFLVRFAELCPGVPVSITSKASPRLLEHVEAWSPTPAVCSVNYGSTVDPWKELLEILERRGVPIEAGAADAAMIDAVCAAEHPAKHLVLLVETYDGSRVTAADRYLALRMHAGRAGFAAPIIAHGRGDATWGIVGAALAAGDHVRVGFEDSLTLPDGTAAASNGELVAAAVRIAESLGRTPIGPAAVAARLAPPAAAGAVAE
jgi:uncharacterized protein (DUF849 family)